MKMITLFVNKKFSSKKNWMFKMLFGKILIKTETFKYHNKIKLI